LFYRRRNIRGGCCVAAGGGCAPASCAGDRVPATDFEDNAYRYRSARGAADAVKDVHRHLRRDYTDVVHADLSRYFDSIPHTEL
jgi:hypothetical protein